MSGDQLSQEEFERIDKLLAKAQDADLGEWDRDFVDDMTKRFGQWGRFVRVTGRQLAQLERIGDSL